MPATPKRPEGCGGTDFCMGCVGGEKGLRLREEPIKRYFELYEEQLRGPSEGEGSPTWRDRLTDQVESLRDMVMGGEVAPLYTWAG